MSGHFSLGQRIRELRLQKGITQIALAKGLLTPSMISQIEADKARPSHKMLVALAERLEVPMENLLVDVDFRLEYESTYKLARAMIAAKQYSSALPLLRELLQASRPTVSSLDILYQIGECQLQTGALDEAEQTFKQAQEHAVLRKDTLLSANIHYHFGLIAAERKLFQIALFHFGKAFDESTKLTEPDHYLQANILHKLGEASLKTGQTSQATEYFEKAAARYEESDHLIEMAHAYLQLGVSHKQLGDIQRASEYSERAHSIFSTQNDLLVSLQLEIQTAALYGASGREDDAEQMLRYSLSKAEFMKHQETQGMAYTELAQLHFQKGDLEKALDFCDQAGIRLPELHVYQAKANRIQARIAIALHNIPEAKHRYQLAADRFKRADEISEWDDTLYELSRLSLQEKDYQQVAHVLEEIRGYTRQVLGARGIRL